MAGRRSGVPLAEPLGRPRVRRSPFWQPAMSEILDRVCRDIREDTYYAQNFDNDGQRFLAW
jgi:hypothetical protein